PPSHTFHGRDLFGPMAALLACGALSFHAVGPPCELEAGPAGNASHQPGEARHGTVVVIDHFGNLITDIEASQLDSVGSQGVLIAGQEVPLVRTYAEAEPGQCVALIGSFGTLEVAARDSDA